MISPVSSHATSRRSFYPFLTLPQTPAIFCLVNTRSPGLLPSFLRFCNHQDGRWIYLTNSTEGLLFVLVL